MSLAKHPIAVVALALLGSGACSNSSTPGGPNAATPTPAPTPTSTPAPTPTSSPAAQSCDLHAKDDCGKTGCCRKGGPRLFDAEVLAAQLALRRTSPELFNRNGSLAVKNERYTATLAEKITELTGLCARGGGHGTSIAPDEVAVKFDNLVSQNTDVIVGATNTPQLGSVFTCRPASF